MKHLLTASLFSFPCITLFVFLLHFLTLRFSEIKEIQSSYDPYLSTQEQNTIEQLLNRYTHYKNQIIVNELSKQIPYSKKITLTFNALQKIFFTLEVQKPLYILNTDFVITENKQVVPRSLYTTECNKNIPTISVPSYAQHSLLDNLCLEMLQKIPQKIYDLYRFEWINECDAFLYHKNNSNFIIRCNNNAIPTEELVKYCQQIQDEYTHLNIIKNHQLIADIRFADQIILYSKKGG